MPLMRKAMMKMNTKPKSSPIFVSLVMFLYLHALSVVLACPIRTELD